jgi:hypothetical protein
MIDVLLACARRPGLAVVAASRLSCFLPVARAIVSVVIFAALICGPHPASAQFAQQAPKLVGTGGVGYNYQGFSVAVSADGNTAIVGGPHDNSETGALWVYTRSSDGVWSQQGDKLVGTGMVGGSDRAYYQAYSVALSADGNTAIVGGFGDNFLAGAAWVFTRSGSVWTQQAKLVGTGAENAPQPAEQGASVAISADGNTAIVGGPGDNWSMGAAWVFTRSGGVWTQQGDKLVGTGSTWTVSNPVSQGSSVALSGDGNTAIVGGTLDNAGAGAAWVYSRSGGVWTQQGSKLVGTGVVGAGGAFQGSSVALSGDGNTAMVGGPFDNTETGAAWVFTRSRDGVWTQQGSKLVGTGVIAGAADQGHSVSLSGDGNTAIVGGPRDNFELGAAWIFTRSGGVWIQQGGPLVGTCSIGRETGQDIVQGSSVALSGDGNTAIVGGPHDNSGIGAAWVFVRSAKTPRNNTHDFDSDGCSDIAWRDTAGNTAVWLMNSTQVVLSTGIGAVPISWSIVGQRDFDGDGKSDLLWHDTSGNVAIWLMGNPLVQNRAGVGNAPIAWSIVGTGDFNGDGKGDILWRDTSGNVAMWFMNGAQVTQSAGVGNAATTWSIVGTGDFDGDGKSDVLWRDTSGNVAIWFMNGAQASGAGVGSVPTNWMIAGTGDFNGDGKSDILWRDTSSGTVAIWFMNGAQVTQAAGVGTADPNVWTIVETGDFDGDGKSDILWQDTTGNVAMWFMNGAQVRQSASVGNVPTVWSVQGAGAD